MRDPTTLQRTQSTRPSIFIPTSKIFVPTGHALEAGRGARNACLLRHCHLGWNNTEQSVSRLYGGKAAAALEHQIRRQEFLRAGPLIKNHCLVTEVRFPVHGQRLMRERYWECCIASSYCSQIVKLGRTKIPAVRLGRPALKQCRWTHVRAFFVWVEWAGLVHCLESATGCFPVRLKFSKGCRRQASGLLCSSYSTQNGPGVPPYERSNLRGTGITQRESHCPLPQGSETANRTSSTAHCPKAARQCAEGVPLPIAQRQ